MAQILIFSQEKIFLAGENFVSQETSFLAGEYVFAHIVFVTHEMCIEECIEYKKRVYEILENELHSYCSVIIVLETYQCGFNNVLLKTKSESDTLLIKGQSRTLWVHPRNLHFRHNFCAICTLELGSSVRVHEETMTFKLYKYST
jgi:hypothetical protein